MVMKQLINILIGCLFLFGMSSCEKDLPVYETPDCWLNFVYYNYDGSILETEKVTDEIRYASYSFVYAGDEVEIDTVWFEISTMGFVSDEDRPLELEQIQTGKNDAKADVHYVAFTNEELKMKFFLAKGPDVPTYVEYGAADIGIVGKDTILEEGRKLYEVMDLGFGKCKMCVCGYKDAAPLLQHHELIRVATKYPNIAKDYFYNKKHQTVEIVKLNGSIELAPIVGLSEVIVDIVETGSTLKENGLVVLEEVCPLSARMIVNPVSMRMENDRIKELITNLRNLLREE